MKILLAALLILGSVTAQAKCSDYYDLAYEQVNSFGFGVIDKFLDTYDKADAEDKTLLKVAVIGGALVTMPYLAVEGGVHDFRSGKFHNFFELLGSTDKGYDESYQLWNDFTSSLVSPIPFYIPEATNAQDKAIAKIVDEMNEKDELCSVTIDSNGNKNVRIFSLNKIERLVKKNLRAQGIKIRKVN